MASPRDVVIIGGGHNGLVAACYLAKAGLKPLVLERRGIVGGAAITDEIHPGYKCSKLAHAAGPLLPEIVHDLRLEQFGLQFLRARATVFAPRDKDGAVVIDEQSPARARGVSASDVDGYVRFRETLKDLGLFLQHLLTLTPPSIQNPSAEDIWNLIKAGRRFRTLNRQAAFRLLRWAPMPAADLVSEWFESDLLRAVTASDGIFGTFLGPRSGGTGAVLLMRGAGKSTIGNGSGLFVRGGLGALTQALARAASAGGAEIKTGAEVDAIDVQQGVVRGIHLISGEVIPSRTVVSNLDPKRTLLQLIDPVHLNPEFLAKIRNYRCLGATAKVNLALGGLPTFSALKSGVWPDDQAPVSDILSGRIHIGPDVDYLERAFDAAKYGGFSAEPYLDVMIPSLSDSSLAPTGRHVMSICVQYAPYRLKTGDWPAIRDKLGDAVVKTLASYAPDLPDLIIEREVITPLDLEQVYGLTGGHIYHGEPSLDQLFTMRPILDWARYRTPIQGLYLCGSGTHPGVGLTGACGRNASREIIKDSKRSKL